MNSKKQFIKIENLLVNPENPRFNSVNNQEEAISIMLRKMGGKIKNLAKDIVVHGLNPGRLLLVLKENNGKYTALEGNRRLTAIKLIMNPNMISLDNNNLRKFFQKIKRESQNNLPKTLECIVFTNKKVANRWIELEHTGENKGVGQVPWDAEQTTRFKSQTSGSQRKHTPVLEFMRQNTIEIPPRQTTNIERIISTNSVKESIGIEIQGQSLSLIKSKKDVIKNLKKIVEKIKSPGFNVEKIYTASKRKKLIKELLREEQSSTKVVRTRRNGRIIRKQTLLERKPLIPEHFNLNISQDKISLIYTELKELEVERFRNAVAVLFRVFLEHSVNYYIKKKRININNSNPALYQKIKGISQYMKERSLLTTDELKPINTATSKDNRHSIWSTDTFNNYTHNLNHIPSANDLKVSWSNFQKFIEKLWN
ncbi:MAG: hypothetical protein OXK80_01605 [Bdellovibrionales bacterium]|nr:hypothetical protein [Bdellovibrionales bacterium]